MTITEYRIHNRDGSIVITRDTQLADDCARAGCVVTARTA